MNVATRPNLRLVACLVGAMLLAPASASAEGRVIRVTTATAQTDRVEEIEWAVGIIETRSSVQVAAEVAGQVRRILVDEGQGVARGAVLAEIDAAEYRLDRASEEAELRRLGALLQQQQRETERARRLVADKLISQDQLDNAEAELAALREQLAGADVRVAATERRLQETRLVAPVTGEVSTRNIDVGDYVQVGAVAFDLIDVRNLRVRLPFPEYRAPQLRKDLIVRLTSAAAGDEAVTARITDIRPSVTPSSRSLTVIVDFDNPGSWRPGASVRAEVVLNARENALLIPQVAVVRRPAGDVVYVIEDGVASARVVRRGERRGKLVEVASGLAQGEIVAVDGAGFLTDGTSVEVAER